MNGVLNLNAVPAHAVLKWGLNETCQPKKKDNHKSGATSGLDRVFKKKKYSAKGSSITTGKIKPKLDPIGRGKKTLSLRHEPSLSLIGHYLCDTSDFLGIAHTS